MHNADWGWWLMAAFWAFLGFAALRLEYWRGYQDGHTEGSIQRGIDSRAAKRQQRGEG